MNDDTDSKRATAIHEAGHAVAHIRHGIQQLKATIVPSDTNLGNVLAEDDPLDKRRAEALAISWCASYGAMVAAGYPADQAVAGCGDDFEKAEEIIAFWQLGTLADWQAKAMEFMRRPENVRGVDLIAKHLLQHSTLDGDYMEVLLDLADGKITEAEFEQYAKSRRVAAMRLAVKELLRENEDAQRAHSAMLARGLPKDEADKEIGRALLGCIFEIHKGMPDRLSSTFKALGDGKTCSELFPDDLYKAGGPGG